MRNVFSHRFTRIRTRAKHGSILMFSVVLMSVAGFSTLSWLAFVTQSQRTAQRDRAQLYALYAAESGVEQVIDYLNNPANYTGQVPSTYDTEKTSPYSIPHNVHPQDYLLFEPYIIKYRTNSDNEPIDENGSVIIDGNGNLITGMSPDVNIWTYLIANGGSFDSKIPTFSLDLSNNTNTVLKGTIEGNEVELARVSEVLVVNPADFALMGDSPVNMSQRPVCKVISTGLTPEGVEVTVEVLLREAPNLNLSSPGAIISRATATFDGQVNVHWGDLLVRGDLPMKTNGQNLFPKESEDPWFNALTEGHILDAQARDYADGRVRGGFTNTPIASTAGDIYYTPFLESQLNSRNNSLRGWENVKQHQNIDFPDYDYEEWKRFFLTNGLPYYFTDSSGTVYGRDDDPNSGTYGQIVGKSFEQWFDINPNASNYWDTLDQLAFIDTVPTDANGNPGPTDADGVPIRNATYKSRIPMASGANLSTIQQSGGGMHSRGAMLICANMDFTGQGNPPGSNSIVDPDGNEYVTDPAGDAPSNSFRVSHNGLIYCYGSIRNGGNRTVYGSLYAERGFSGNGSREVYYNYRLKDGSFLDLNMSRVERVQWSVRKSDATLPNA